MIERKLAGEPTAMPALFGGGDDGRRQGMLARALERGREPQQVGLGSAGQRDDRGDLGLALGQRAGLVDHDGVDLLQPLERFGVLDQDAQARAAADADHDRHRGGEAQGARAGDDQHRDGGDQAVGERGRRAPQPPGHERERGDRDHRRHEPAGDLVGEPLDRRARALRLGHHLDDAREHRLLADLLRAHDEAAPAVERAADHLGTGLLLDRQRLAGDHALVDRARSFDDLAVDRHAIARPHPQPIVREHLVERHFLVAAVLAQPPRGLGSEVEERLDGAAGLLARAQLEHLAQENQDRDDRGRLEVDGDRAVRAAKAGREEAGGDRADHAVDPGDAGAERDQREHVEVAAFHRRPAALEERPAGPEHDGRPEEELQPVAGLLPQEHVQVGEMPAHLEGQDRERQHQADPEAPGHVGELGVRPGLRRHVQGLERHAADRAGARAHLPHLRVHRAGVDRVRPRRRRHLVAKVAVRVGRELGAAPALQK